MKTLAALLLALGVIGLAHPSLAAERSHKERAAFMRLHPCPATGKTKGACPGYVIDHVKPLCAGGPDRPSNMQWQTAKEAKIKDKQERKLCAKQRDI